MEIGKLNLTRFLFLVKTPSLLFLGANLFSCLHCFKCYSSVHACLLCPLFWHFGLLSIFKFLWQRTFTYFLIGDQFLDILTDVHLCFPIDFLDWTDLVVCCSEQRPLDVNWIISYFCIFLVSNSTSPYSSLIMFGLSIWILYEHKDIWSS